MRSISFALGLAVVGTFLVALAPTSSAAAVCVRDVKEPIPEDRCDGLICYGWNPQVGWQTCVPPDLCAYMTDCCQYVSTGNGFYCP
jgi:hypothetical protein